MHTELEVFITTFNRPQLLRESIESILNSKYLLHSITIVDNGDTLSTSELIQELNDTRIKYVKTTGKLGNYKKIKEIAKANYVMIFHDDDILNPNYISMAMDAVFKDPSIVLVASRLTDFQNQNEIFGSMHLDSEFYKYKNYKDFVNNMFIFERIAYSNAIYRTEFFKKVELEYDRFGKINDWPLMTKVAKFGTTILFTDCKCVFARQHDGQDSRTVENQIQTTNIVNWIYFLSNNCNLRNPFIRFLVYRRARNFLEGHYKGFISENKMIDEGFDILEQMAIKVMFYIKYVKILDILNRYESVALEIISKKNLNK
jgi:GT2 family glycosyltransferase